MAAIVASISSLLLLMIGGIQLDANPTTWTLFAWLTLTSVGGAWTILTLSKWWEETEGEHIRRRFVLLAAGLLVGLASFGASAFLGVEPTDELGVTSVFEPASRLPAFLVYFRGAVCLGSGGGSRPIRCDLLA